MKNLEKMKKEVIEILPKVRDSLRLKRAANKQLQDIQDMLKDSYCYDRYFFSDFSIEMVLNKAVNEVSSKVFSYGLTSLGSYAQRESYTYSHRPLYEFITLIRYIKKHDLTEILDDVVEHVSSGDSYDKRQYIVKNNKIKYIAGRYCSGMSSYRILCTMLDFIQLYEISINKDITNNEVRSKLQDAFSKNNDLSVIVYKHIKISVYQNGNYEITFGNKKELEKVYKNITETIERRNARRAA